MNAWGRGWEDGMGYRKGMGNVLNMAFLMPLCVESYSGTC